MVEALNKSCQPWQCRWFLDSTQVHYIHTEYASRLDFGMYSFSRDDGHGIIADVDWIVTWAVDDARNLNFFSGDAAVVTSPPKLHLLI